MSQSTARMAERMKGKFGRGDKRITVQCRGQRERIRRDGKRERDKVKGRERKSAWVIIPVLGRVQKPAQKSTHPPGKCLPQNWDLCSRLQIEYCNG